MTYMKGLVETVRRHANENWGKDGWDIIAECWDDDDIRKAIGGAYTEAGAVRKVAAVAEQLQMQRAEQMDF